MKRKLIALATVLIILCTSTAQAFAATSPETITYTYEEYYAAIQECFARYGIVWEGPTTNPYPDYVYTTDDLELALAQAHAYCEKATAGYDIPTTALSAEVDEAYNNLQPHSVMYHTYSMKKSNHIFDMTLLGVPREITIETSTDILTELLTYSIISCSEPSLRVTGATGFDDYVKLLSYTYSVTKNNTTKAELVLDITCEVKESLTIGAVESWTYAEKSYTVRFSPFTDLD